ncbi:MAG TPA: cation diffusion facilitator family transporter [Armatimonadota bacterium]|nr:cation diffusion facilitator family transporter [Armatimonadota bacterium]
MDPQRQKSAVAWLSVLSNLTLVLVKLVIGVMIQSVSVISEAIHSGVDLVAAIIALFAVKSAGKPADNDHPYGHGKIENVSGTVEALLIFLAAAWIIYEAVDKLVHHSNTMNEVGWGIGIMLISSVANMIVSHLLFVVGKRTDSIALQADAWHLRTDVYTSAGVMGGLAIIWLGGKLLPPSFDLRWVDPVAAIGVALLIIRAAWELTVQSSRDLLDASLPPEEEAWIRGYIGRLRPTIRGFHRLRTRKAGSTRFIEFHLIVEADMSVLDSHRISDVIECDIEEHLPNSNVTVHIEPCTGECKPLCSSGCLLTNEEKSAIKKVSQAT